MRELIDNISDGLVKKLWTLASFVLLFIYCEAVLHISVYASIDINIVYPILFSLIFGSIGFLLCSLCPDKVNRILTILYVTVTVLWYETQLIYHSIFRTFMPLNQIFMGKAALGNFFSQTVYAIITNIVPVIVMLIPIPLLILLICTKRLGCGRLRMVQIMLSLLLSVFVSLTTLIILILTSNAPASPYRLLTNPELHSEQCIKTNGLAVTTLRELMDMLDPPDTSRTLTASSLSQLDNEGKELNISNIDLSQYDDPISKYLNTVSPTAKNEYTGIAEGYNLITICAEAFSPAVIDEELTPTLYKLSNGGIVFNNFYATFPNTTTNGEYTLCTGLFPDTSRNKTEASFNDSANNYLPLCLGNALREIGYTTYAYHNYYGTFYDRHMTHPNMGYDFKAIGNGLDIPLGSPSSDLDMIEASMPDYIDSDEPFHIYYMTYSGHYQYNWDNEMSAKNKHLVEQLPYNERTKAYIACQLELEYALTALMDELERSGQADRTVIALTTDHYPYGLDKESYYSIADKGEYPDFDIYRNSFICYIPGIDPVEVDSFCSTQDILPTLLNIMGISFDSRMLPGRDIMSNAHHIAVLSDHSFICDDFRYNAATGEVISHSDKTISNDTLEEYKNYADNMFTLSEAILENDYYSKVYQKQNKPQSSILKFDDLQENNVYIESTVVFMVQNGFMQPKSETEFGINDKGTVKEFIDVLFAMSSYSDEYDSAYKWAISTELVTEAQLTNENASTYSDVAEIIYKYIALTKEHTKTNISDICASYPDIPKKSVIALKWCHDNKIISGSVDNPVYELWNVPVTRYHIAAFLERLYIQSFIS